MAKWHDATIVERINWNSHLFSLRFTCDEFNGFKAGQFVKVGVEVADGQILSRPYSLVNPPSQKYLEIMAVPVLDGSLSPKLHELNMGDTLKLMSPATGFLTIDEVPQSENLFMLATGTGVGPFLSIIKDGDVWKRHQKVILVYGARKIEDLAYLNDINEIKQKYPSQFSFVPVTSREKLQSGLHGRIPELLRRNEVQNYCGEKISQNHSQVMLCGNPEMIKDALDVLAEFGLKKHLRRSPGQISMERYW